ncbi:MAG: HEAT repeat domain-containing protein [Desulfuromonadales bacterium]|nr:HEAT repeat domain-containing protein [Desulfuromonadales bacterium]
MNDSIRQRIDALVPLLKDTDPDVRTTVARAIEHLEAAGDLNEILYTLKTGDMGARIAAIYALGEIGGAGVINPLVYCAGRPELDIRAAAVEILGRLAEPSTLPVLLERLNDRNTTIQARAITALSNFPFSAALCDQLRPFLEANDGELEAETTLALARLGDRSATTRIIYLLTSPYASTRKAAATALSLLPL